MSAVLVIQHAVRKWPLRLYHFFPHYLTTSTIIGKKVTKHKVCFGFLYKFCLKHCSFQEEFRATSQIHIGLHVNHTLFLCDFVKVAFSRQTTQVRGFKPDRSRRILKGEKTLSTPFFGGEVKPSVPCRRFAACKRSLNGVEVVISAKLPDNILAHSSHFRRWDLVVKSGNI